MRHSATRSRARRRTVAAGAGVILTLGLLAGCGDRGDQGSTKDHHDSAGSTPTCHATTNHACYTYPAVVPSYCETQMVRKMIADGKLDAADLPAWADKTERDGTPLIINFSQAGSVSAERRLDQLGQVLDRHGLHVQHADVRACIKATTPQVMARTQGKAPAS